MKPFTLNGYLWTVEFVDPYSEMLVDRSGVSTLGTSDPEHGRIWLSSELHGEMLLRVLLHELGHCTLFSFGMLEELHEMVYPQYWERAEEWVCNFISDYGLIMFSAAYSVLGVKAIDLIPDRIERLIA